MDRLSEIRVRCEAATPGPWQSSKSNYGVIMLFNGTGRALLGPPEGAGNAAFIANARDDIPYLLEQHAQLAAEIERLHGLLAERNVLLDKYEAENRWIPVGERLPEPETNVLICQHYHEDAPYAKITIGHLHQDRDLRHKPYWNWIAHGADMVHPKIEAYHRAEFICPGKEFVTHWRPLPEPPKGE